MINFWTCKQTSFIVNVHPITKRSLRDNIKNGFTIETHTQINTAMYSIHSLCHNNGNSLHAQYNLDGSSDHDMHLVTTCCCYALLLAESYGSDFSQFQGHKPDIKSID